MRASRLLSMLLLLQVRGRMSAAALAREFEVSVRTVYRDADHLSAAGVPVYAERGRSGGFRLLDDFGARLAALTPNEAEALALSSVTQAAIDLGLTDGAASAQRKLLASLPGDTGAARVAARFHLDPLPWYGRRAPPPVLLELAAAVWRDARLRITYDSWRGEVSRTLQPLGLVMKAGAWYLVATTAGQPKRAAPATTQHPATRRVPDDRVRTYRVDAIRELKVMPPRAGGAARATPRFDLARYWAGSVRRFEQALVSATVRVRLTATGLRMLRDFHPHAWEAVQQQAPVADAQGRIEVCVPFESGAQGVHDALRMGAEMEVLAPGNLRAAVAAAALQCAALHRPATPPLLRRSAAQRGGGRQAKATSKPAARRA